MNCETFRRILAAGQPLEGDALAHMRSCSSCLERAVDLDPDNLFRSLGGDEMLPPGGVEPFVQSVLDGVHVRQTENRIHHVATVPAWSRWAVAAALGLTVISAALFYRTAPQSVPVPMAAVQQPVQIARAAVSRPVIENYENANATIVELASADDMQVVMVFDDTLPADL
jgi:hypothetical protein